MVSMQDIASDLGISQSVVSRALNPSPDANARIAESTRKRILEAASHLGYRRNRLAEFMKRKRSATIGVFIPEMANSLIADLIFGISGQANDEGFPISIHVGMCMNSYVQFIRESCDKTLSGIITYSAVEYFHPEAEKVLQEYKDNGGKVLILNNITLNKYVNLSMDERYGGELAAEALLKNNCSNYFHLGSRDITVNNTISPLRNRGFADRLEKEKIKAGSFTKCEDVFNFIMRHPEKLCGVFSGTDCKALQLINLGRVHGLEAGHDYKLVGYDNIDFADKISPALTTIAQPFRKQGNQAVRKIIKMIYNKKQQNEFVKPELIRRETA